ncbi:MAG TPA: ROK family protein [Candidatus Sabulitectum sp.]|nr:ROK family protein [Candidatus Sabulitectum sp.]
MSSRGCYWGVDVGGSYAKIGRLVQGGFQLTDSIPTGAGSEPASVLQAAASAIRRWDSEPLGVGLGAAGLIDREGGRIVFSPNLPGWGGCPVASILENMLGVPVVLDNDCNVFATGALYSGEIPGKGLWLFITLGTGIGGTIISEGSIVYGTGGAGEFGHSTVREGGLPCPCGSVGCWEMYAGARALEWYYRRVSGGASSPRGIASLAHGGDPAALEAYREYGRWFGIGLANLANIFAPHGFFIAGGLSAGLRHFGIPARTEFLRRCRHPWSVSMLEDSPEAGAFGAASMARGRC